MFQMGLSSTNLTIVVTVVPTACVLLIVVGIVVYCCCCRKRSNNESGAGLKSPFHADKAQPSANVSTNVSSVRVRHAIDHLLISYLNNNYIWVYFNSRKSYEKW